MSRDGCHLCEEALAVVDRVCGSTGEEYAGDDVTLDRADADDSSLAPAHA